MNLRLLIGSAVACALVTAVAALVFDMSFARAAVLAPVIVVTFGATVGLGVLWTKVIWESLRGQHGPPSA
ncbi:MAG: hypothetical protein H0V84_00900 [Actinobacteria bacterium]|nr:hypothetical protein [Actinomycetota bacterium]